MVTLNEKFLDAVSFGEPKTYKNLTIFPLFISLNDGPTYIPLKEAVETDSIAVTEINGSGSVPDLKVANQSENQILLLAGEELLGAKQNRTINTTILLKAKIEMLIPVSCTEGGRWSYSSRRFSHAGSVVPRGLRAIKFRSVAASMTQDNSHRSDQQQVWSKIAEMHDRASITSETAALHELNQMKSNDLGEIVQAFEPLPNQRGSLVYLNGEAVGLEIISRAQVYAALHPMLIESHAVDALLDHQEVEQQPTAHDATAFLQSITLSEGQRFKGIGQGHEYRFENDNLTGSMLVCHKHIIHMAFFKKEPERQASHRSRRSRRPMSLRRRIMRRNNPSHQEGRDD